MLIKPAGPDCNLRCKYCFYLEKHALFAEKNICRMSDEVMEQLIRSYLASQPQEEVEFAWQGGEPTLMGLDFFKRAVELQKKYAGGHKVCNSFQTNGTLLDDSWCEFMAKENFLIGLSIDGPEEIHNRYRIYDDGRGTFAKVENAAKLMRKHGVEYNALTCITRESAYEGRKIYRYLRDHGFKFMQFIPIIERRPNERSEELGLDLSTPPELHNADESTAVMPFTVEPLQYGQFLIDIFNEWVRHDIGNIFVNHFDITLSRWCGMNPALCGYSKVCGAAMAGEHDGTVYACDHFVYPEYARGNIMTDDMAKILCSTQQQAFGMSKAMSMPEYCRSCKFVNACNGGCLKHRFAKTPTGDPGLNYLCPGFKLFFNYIDPYMQKMADLIKMGRPASDIVESLPKKQGPTKPTAKNKRKRNKKKNRKK
jgi:uncharacterized protein